MKLNLPNWWQKNRQLLLVWIIPVLCIGTVLFFAGYWLSGYLLNHPRVGSSNNTFWWWVRLIIVPIGLGISSLSVRMSRRLSGSGIRPRQSTHNISSDGHTAQRQPAAISHGAQRDEATTEENG